MCFLAFRCPVSFVFLSLSSSSSFFRRSSCAKTSGPRTAGTSRGAAALCTAGLRRPTATATSTMRQVGFGQTDLRPRFMQEQYACSGFAPFGRFVFRIRMRRGQLDSADDGVLWQRHHGLSMRSRAAWAFLQTSDACRSPSPARLSGCNMGAQVHGRGVWVQLVQSQVFSLPNHLWHG